MKIIKNRTAKPAGFPGGLCRLTTLKLTSRAAC